MKVARQVFEKQNNAKIWRKNDKQHREDRLGIDQEQNWEKDFGTEWNRKPEGNRKCPIEIFDFYSGHRAVFLIHRFVDETQSPRDIGEN